MTPKDLKILVDYLLIVIALHKEEKSGYLRVREHTTKCTTGYDYPQKMYLVLLNIVQLLELPLEPEDRASALKAVIKAQEILRKCGYQLDERIEKVISKNADMILTAIDTLPVPPNPYIRPQAATTAKPPPPTPTPYVDARSAYSFGKSPYTTTPGARSFSSTAPYYTSYTASTAGSTMGSSTVRSFMPPSYHRTTPTR